MSNIILKKSSVAARVPAIGDLVYGELALNYTDGALYYKRSDNTIQNLIVAGTGGGGTGSVTSVGLSVPTGLSVANTPITSAGTIAISFAEGYSIPTTAKQGNWDIAYGWGNHADANYLTTAASTNFATAAQGTKADNALQSASIGTTVQGYNANTVIDASYVHTDNNYTTTEQTKLAGIATGAEVNVNADWDATSGDAQILNKPTLFDGAYSSLSGTPTLGTAAAADTSAFATAAQGTLADSALQSTSLKTINGESIVGTGDITITGGGGGISTGKAIAMAIVFG